MEVILKRDVPNVGRVGDLVRVKNGFARNYLLPRDLAAVANIGNKRNLEHHRRMIEAAKKKIRLESEERSKEVEKIKLKFERRFTETGKMFGAVTSTELLKELSDKHKLQLDRRDLDPNEIRAEGKHSLKLRLPGDVFTEIQIEVKVLKETKEKKEKSTEKKAGSKKASAKKEATTDEEEASSGEDTSTLEAAPVKAKKAKKTEEKA
ncbi:MAG: 50S ribosomal protein L9 [Bradymonadales bacterium]|nr:MAG: 50S ribosomal protein L9 [Bradymonadales bacterium]